MSWLLSHHPCSSSILVHYPLILYSWSLSVHSHFFFTSFPYIILYFFYPLVHSSLVIHSSLFIIQSSLVILYSWSLSVHSHFFFYVVPLYNIIFFLSSCSLVIIHPSSIQPINHPPSLSIDPTTLIQSKRDHDSHVVQN